MRTFFTCGENVTEVLKCQKYNLISGNVIYRPFKAEVSFSVVFTMDYNYFLPNFFLICSV